MALDISNVADLSVQINATAYNVVAVWDSLVGPYQIVAITDQTAPNNIYRFKPDGSSDSANITLMSDSDVEWAAALPWISPLFIRTNASGVLQFQELKSDGTYTTRALDAINPASGLATWPPNLTRRRLLLKSAA